MKRYCRASPRCSEVTASARARSAIVRATRMTRWNPRADKWRRSAGRSSSVRPALSSGAHFLSSGPVSCALTRTRVGRAVCRSRAASTWCSAPGRRPTCALSQVRSATERIESALTRQLASAGTGPLTPEHIEVPFSPAVRTLLSAAALIADELGSKTIDPLHLLVALLKDEGSSVAQLRRDGGASAAAILAKLRPLGR